MVERSFHDMDYRGYFVRRGEYIYFVTDEDVDRANGSIHTAVTNSHSDMPNLSRRSKYLANNLKLLAR